MNDWFKKIDRTNTDSIKWQLAKEACNQDECFTFNIADSDYETAPVVKKALIERVKHGAFGYATTGKEYEEIIINWYYNQYGVSIEKESIITAPTVLNAISVIINLLTKEEDEILIQTPVYHMFRTVIEDNHRKVIDNTLIDKDNSYQIDFNDLESTFAKGVKVFVFCNPHNPVARVWKEEELDRLVSLAKKYDVLIISDEIHSDIIMPGYTFTSMSKYFNIYNQIIIISAPTKVFNIAGLQIAQIIVMDKQLNKLIKNAYQKLHLSTPNLLAVTALKTAYQNGYEWLIAQNSHIHDNYNLLKESLSKYGMMFTVYPLEGTYLAWIKVNISNKTTEQFVNELTDKGVFVTDGSKFGHSKDFIRISLACSDEQLLSGLAIIETYLNKL